MKSRLVRLLSLATAIVLTVTAFPLFASAASFNQIVNAATDIIMTNEGNYTTVVRNDNGSLSIGKICWHGTNALNLLKEIVAANPNQALNILGTDLYNEIITSYSWDTKIPSTSEASVIAILLSTAESRNIQDRSAWEFISDYVSHGQSLGVTDPEALVFFADYENQNGRNGAASFCNRIKNSYGTLTLETLYAGSNKSSRRTRTYNFCKSINWSSYSDMQYNEKDTVAPQISDVVVSDVNSAGYTVSCTAEDNIAVTTILFAVYHEDDGSDAAKWYKLDTTSTASMTVDIGEFGNRTGNYCTYIYAFDAAGNYTYVELNTVKVPEATPAETPFSLTVSAESDGKVGGEIRWRAAASGGSGNYQYIFYLYKDEEIIDRRYYSDYSDFSYTVKETGVYKVFVSVKDMDTGKTASAISSETNIFTPIDIESFSANIPAAIIGQSIFWEVKATGGEGDLSYSYTVYKDDELLYSTPFNQGNYKFQYKPGEEGVYHVTAYVQDSRSQLVSVKSDSITVIRPLSAENVSFSTDYAVAGMRASVSVDVLGGTGSYTCRFSIYNDGVLVLVSNEMSASEFSFTVPSAGNYTASVTVTDADSTVTEATGGSMSVSAEAIRGDANCDAKVNAADARLTLRIAAGLEVADEIITKAIDITGDGKITAADARRILRAVARIESL